MANPKIQLRHDTSTNWQTQNPVLLEGEVAIETDSNKVKIGNGTDNYNTLPYITDQTKVDLDYSNADYQPVNKAGDTMTGSLIVSNSGNSNQIIAQGMQIDKTVTPTTNNLFSGLKIIDKNSAELGSFYYRFDTAGSKRSAISCIGNNNNAYLLVGLDANETPFCEFPNTTCCDGQWVHLSQQIISSSTSLKGSSALTYAVNIPSSGGYYEVLIYGEVETGTSSGNSVVGKVYGDVTGTASIGQCKTRTASSATAAGSGTVIVNSSTRKISITRNNNWNGSCTYLVAVAYRRIGTNA